jgi:hypothetical protein
MMGTVGRDELNLDEIGMMMAGVSAAEKGDGRLEAGA